MPLWKWILLFIASFLIFTIIYSFEYTFEYFIDVTNYPHALVSFYYIAYGLVMLGLYMLWRRWLENGYSNDVINRRVVSDVGMGLCIGALMMTLTTVIIMGLGCCHLSLAEFRRSAIIMTFAMYFFVAVSEEVIFRGFMFRMISERWGFMPALIVSALVFGLLHIITGGGNFWGGLAISIEAGLLLGAAYHYAQSLWLPIGIHWTWNFVQGSVFGFNVSGVETDLSIFKPALSGPEIITGGVFGPEASIITVVLGLALSLYLIAKSKNKTV